MVFCVAFGCSNGDNSGKSFFIFPSRLGLGVLAYAKIIFDSSCFVTDPAVYQSVCFKPGRQRLKKSTLTCPIIPTIFKRIWEIETKKRRSLPFQKRRNLEISRSDSNTKWWQEYVSNVDKYKVIMAQLRLVQIMRKCPIYEWLL